MSDRPTASTITDAQLDELYEQLERAQRVAMQALDDEPTPSRRTGLRDEIANALEAADYSGNMRRGDLADAVMPVLYREWPWLRAEAEDAAELRRRIATLEHVAAGNRRHVQLIVPDLERAEAAIERVRKLAARIRQGAPWTANDDDIAAHILAALDEPKEQQ
jgi:hypothetical protein